MHCKNRRLLYILKYLLSIPLWSLHALLVPDLYFCDSGEKQSKNDSVLLHNLFNLLISPQTENKSSSYSFNSILDKRIFTYSSACKIEIF